MKVFIDTNVFLDYIQQRPEGWKEAEVIFFLAIHGDIELLVSDLTIANMRYVTRKDIGLEQFYAVMKGLRPYYHVVPLGGSVLIRLTKSSQKILRMPFNILQLNRLEPIV